MFLKFKNIIINIDNIGFFKIKDKKYFCQYRKKASIKEIEVPIIMGNLPENQFFMKYNFYRLGDYFINPKAITFINKENIPNSNEIKIHFTFINGLELNIQMDSGRFNIWENTRLRR